MNMSKTSIPSSYLPPRDYLPRNIKTLPELEYPAALNLTETLLDRNVAERGDKVAIYYEDERITYRQLRARVDRFANALRELGVGKGDRVVLRSFNMPECLVWNFACWRIGAVPVLVSQLNRAPELAFKINDSEAVAICVHIDNAADLEKARPDCPQLQHVIVYGGRLADTYCYDDLVRGYDGTATSEVMRPDDVARIIYSSGTTGKPKGIVGTVEGILSGGDTAGRHVLKLREDDVLGGHPSFSFALGAAFLFLPWQFGAALSITPAFTPERQFALAREHGITLLIGAPTAFRLMLEAARKDESLRLPSVRLCQSAGEPLPDSTFIDWRKRFGLTIVNALGSGELNYWLSTSEELPDSKIGATGLSVPGYENVIVDEQLNPVPAGTPGELLVRGPMGQMYWRRPDAQMKGVCPPDSKYAGWSRPGLYCCQDEDGYFWFKSRLDDMIVTAGYKVPAGEVEGALNNHPSVFESAVIGVPDEGRGNVIKAFVVLKEGVTPSERLVQVLQDFVKQEIEPYKYPRMVEFVAGETLPRTATGKIQRHALRNWTAARC